MHDNILCYVICYEHYNNIFYVLARYEYNVVWILGTCDNCCYDCSPKKSAYRRYPQVEVRDETDAKCNCILFV